MLFVRKHWVAARLRTATKSIEVWDSAKSSCVQRDLQRVACALRRTLVQHDCPQQNRGTNECGVFAVAFVLLLSQGQQIPERNTKVSLAQLRDAWPNTGDMTALAQKAFGMRAQTSESARSPATESTDNEQARPRVTAGRGSTTKSSKLEALGHQMAARNAAEWKTVPSAAFTELLTTAEAWAATPSDVLPRERLDWPGWNLHWKEHPAHWAEIGPCRCDACGSGENGTTPSHGLDAPKHLNVGAKPWAPRAKTAASGGQPAAVSTHVGPDLDAVYKRVGYIMEKKKKNGP